MKILFASAKPMAPFAVGGDTVTQDILIQYLSKKYFCEALGSYNPALHLDDTSPKHVQSVLQSKNISFEKHFPSCDSFEKICLRFFSISQGITFSYIYHGSKTRLVHQRIYLDEFRLYIRNSRPDIVVTYTDKAFEILRICRDLSVPAILIIHDMENYNYELIKFANTLKQIQILFVSNTQYHKFHLSVKVANSIWLNPVYQIRLRPRRKKGKYITMINPVQCKGGEIFKQIAKKVPDQQFCALINWYDPIKDGIDLSNIRNVTLLPRKEEISNILLNTKLLLVPSHWEETSPRVIPEAGSFGIPCIVSRRGGLPECVGQGGIIIDDPYSINEWVRAIARCRNESFYKKISLRAQKKARNNNAKNQCKLFDTHIHNVLSSHDH